MAGIVNLLAPGIPLVVALSMSLPPYTDAAESLVWRRDQQRVDAHVESWPLPKVLATISSATGWDVYVEPGTAYRVTARFQNLTPRDALLRLLGELNFALLPQTTGPPKLFVYRTSLHEATQMIASDARTPKRIAEELVVGLKPGAKGIDALARRFDARVVGRLDSVNAYRLRFADEATARKARSQMERTGELESIEDNFAIAAPGVLEPLSLSSPPGLALTPNVSPATDRVVVGLIDTAVQSEGTVFKNFLQPSVSLYDDYQPPADRITHGSAMAETIVDGVARALEERGDGSGKVALSILPIDVYGAHESTTTFDVARGLYEALDRHANVINLSLAGDNESPLVKSLIVDATSHGVLCFAAAGNTPVTTPTYPAADPGVIAVTAGDARGDIAPYANRGSFVDAVAPGVNVVHYRDEAWLGSGTSFATTWVSGWAAGIMASAGQSSAATRSQTMARWGLASKSSP